MNRENYCIDNEGLVTVCDGLHDGDGCEYRPILASEMLSLVKRAALFDWLAARSCIWRKDKNKLFVYDDDGHEFCHEAPTLADAVKLAMESEAQ